MSKDDVVIDGTMTVLDVVSRYPGTEEVFGSYDEVAGECICCNALFDTLAAVTARTGIDLGELIGRIVARASERGAATVEESFFSPPPPRQSAGKETAMKHGARNAITAKVRSVKKGEVMSLVKFDVTTPATMASVLTTESLEEMELRPGDEVSLVVKAIHVLPLKE